MRSSAIVTRNDASLSKVAYIHHVSASPAPQHSRQQCPPASAGFCFSIGFHEIVGRMQGLNPLVLLPVNITGMVVANQDTPLRAWLGMPLALTSTAIHDLCSYSSPPISISSGIERIRKDSPNRTVDRQFPEHRGRAWMR